MWKHILVGCTIAGVLTAGVSLKTSAALRTTQVTFDKDVLPQLQRNCQSCHRPGQIAPMPLLTYKDARPWAKAMKDAVLTKMPPWFADPQYQHFDNSVNNKFNPDPNKTVYYGDMTWEEMMFPFFSVVVDKNVDPKKVIRIVRGRRG